MARPERECTPRVSITATFSEAIRLPGGIVHSREPSPEPLHVIPRFDPPLLA